MKKKLLKVIKGIAFFLLGLIVAIVILLLKENVFKEDKLKMMRNHLLYDYYDEEKLTSMLKEELGADYEGDLKVDFDNFVLRVVMDELAQYETEKNEPYNTFFSKSKMSALKQVKQEQAQKTAGYAIDESIYYLNIDRFAQGVTYKRINELTSDMKQHENLIIDLRNNSGGDMDELNKILSLFLENDTHMYSEHTRDKLKDVYAKGGEPLTFNEIVILVNGETASASEIFLLGMKENLEHVTVLGETTYGKDIIYGIREFDDQSALFFILSVMKGKNGTAYSGGIEPDIYEVQNDDSEDNQLDSAVNYIISNKSQ